LQLFKKLKIGTNEGGGNATYQKSTTSSQCLETKSYLCAFLK